MSWLRTTGRLQKAQKRKSDLYRRKNMCNVLYEWSCFIVNESTVYLYIWCRLKLWGRRRLAEFFSIVGQMACFFLQVLWGRVCASNLGNVCGQYVDFLLRHE